LAAYLSWMLLRNHNFANLLYIYCSMVFDNAVAAFFSKCGWTVLSLAIKRFWASSPQTILRGACVCLRGAPPAVHLMKKHVLHAFREVGRVAPLTNKHSKKNSQLVNLNCLPKIFLLIWTLKEFSALQFFQDYHKSITKDFQNLLNRRIPNS